MAQQDEAISSQCPLCTDPDDGNMIGCSKCNTIYHYSCCNIVDDSDFASWLCEFCCRNGQQSLMQSNHQTPTQHINLAPPNATQQVHTDDSNVDHVPLQNSPHRRASLAGSTRPDISYRKQLQLQMLEEEMCLKQEFLRRKFKILLSDDIAEDQLRNVRPVENLSLYSQIRETPFMHNYQQDINTAKSQQNNDGINLQHAQNARTSINDPQCQSTIIQQMQNPPLNIPNQRSQMPNPPNENSQNRRSDNAFVMTGSQNITFADVNNTRGFGNLTSTQIMARQCVSKELPSFNGDPREWPIFISAFEQSTIVAGYSNEENLIRLQKCLTGKARDAVRNCLMLPDMVPDIIRTLKMYFGRPECVLKSLIDEVRKMVVQKGKLEALVGFAFAVKNICATIRASHLDDYFINPTLLQELVDKLPADTLLQWALHSNVNPRPTLLDFSNWLYTIAEATCKVSALSFDTSSDTKVSRRDSRLNTHVASSNETPGKSCLICNETHKLGYCTKFQALAIDERWNIVKVNNLCRVCLGKHRRRCWFQRPCGVNDCTVQHHPLLHNSKETTDTTNSILNSHKTFNEPDSYFRIVPVTLHSDTKSINIYALMDDGSTLTLLEETVADSLGVDGTKEPLCLRWTGDVSRFEENSRRFDLKISATNSNSKTFPIKNIYTVKNLNLPPETMNAENLISKYPHLRDIPLKSYKNVIPSMIIGINNPNLTSCLKIREGGWQQPVATKTRLGWTIFGGIHRLGQGLNLHKCQCGQDADLHNIVKQYFSDESIGVSSPSPMPVSRDDQLAIRTLEETCKINNGRYECGLLWKNDNVELPQSIEVAMKRLECLKRKAKRDPNLANMLQKQIANLEEKGYAQRLPMSAIHEKGGKIWYLPTFIVKNPQKPGKIRLVWDAAAKSGEFSLNEFLLKGPDLLSPLMNILFKFRMGAVAICGDIEEMFHRIMVRKEDACAQRFMLWDENNSYVIYPLNVLTFGATCSPCIAHFVRNKNAEKFASNNAKVYEAITKQHYVDDFIDSANSVEEATELAIGVRDVHRRGAFNMRNWSSNSVHVLHALGETKPEESKSFNLNESENQYEKILGIFW